MEKTKDEIVMDLQKQVKLQKEEISKIEKYSWNTNCAFRYSLNIGDSAVLNIKTVSDVKTLVDKFSFLVNIKNSYKEANKILNTGIDFDWYGYSFEDWSNDFKQRIKQIELTEKRKELEEVETRLNKLISAELRDKMEIEELMKKLSK